MHLDVDLHAELQLNEDTVRTKGLQAGIEEALIALRFKLSGSVYIPYTGDNEELYEKLDPEGVNTDHYDDYSFDEEKIRLVDITASNTENKQVLTQFE